MAEAASTIRIQSLSTEEVTGSVSATFTDENGGSIQVHLRDVKTTGRAAVKKLLRQAVASL